MSTVAFGALTTRREASDSGKSTSAQPPGLNSYVDTLAALVPAEVLAIHMLVMSIVTTTDSQGRTTLADAATLRVAFWLLIGLSAVLYVLGRRPVPTPAQLRKTSDAAPFWQRWEWQDWIRLLIPPAAFVGWTMLEPVSAWTAVAPHTSIEMRVLIATVTAVMLAAVTKALVSHADNKQPPAPLTGQAIRAQMSGKVTTKDVHVTKEPQTAGKLPAHQPTGYLHDLTNVPVAGSNPADDELTGPMRTQSPRPRLSGRLGPSDALLDQDCPEIEPDVARFVLPAVARQGGQTSAAVKFAHDGAPQRSTQPRTPLRRTSGSSCEKRVCRRDLPERRTRCVITAVSVISVNVARKP
jgi:hypothetical protein